MLAGGGPGPHGQDGGDVAEGPQPGMGIFAMMSTIATVPVPLPYNGNGQ